MNLAATTAADHSVPPIARWQVPADWQHIEFISDLHLQRAEGATLAAWESYLASSTADAIVILGDLFEVWVGDDAIDAQATIPEGSPSTPSFEAHCAAVLRAATRRLPVFFMHGNRDFLLGERFAQLTGTQCLSDPTLLTWQGDDDKHSGVLLSHGDALCLDDVAYQAFRAEVRTRAWQAHFLSKPLAERVGIARHIRTESEATKRMQPLDSSIDLDSSAARAWLVACGASTLLHGHTHRPAEHDLGHGMRRVVLSDWDVSAQPPRAQVLGVSHARSETGGSTVVFQRTNWP